MYSHEVLHFLSGVFGSLLGCWLYFGIQKRKTTAAAKIDDDQR